MIRHLIHSMYLKKGPMEASHQTGQGLLRPKPRLGSADEMRGSFGYEESIHYHNEDIN